LFWPNCALQIHSLLASTFVQARLGHRVTCKSMFRALCDMQNLFSTTLSPFVYQFVEVGVAFCERRSLYYFLWKLNCHYIWIFKTVTIRALVH